MFYNRSTLELISVCVLLHSCRGKMLILSYTRYFSAFLSSFVSFHFVFSFLNALVYSVSEVTDTIQTNLPQRFLVVTKNSILERVMQFPYSCKSVFALQSVWVKTGTLQWWRNWKPHKWMDVRVTLEQFTGSDGMRDSILFIYYMYHEEKKVCSA